MANEKRLIDANAFRKSINGWKLGKIPKGELLWDLDRQPTVDAVEVSRLGKLGRLMMPYQGCPRGHFGERGCSGDGRAYFTVMELDAIVDVDGNRWIPVLDRDLDALKDKKKNAVEVVHGRWENNHCTVCGMTPLGEELWDHLDIEPPRFELCMDYCPCCGADMRGGEE